MVVSLLGVLADHPSPFQQVVGDVAAHHLALPVKVDLDELAKSARVVVPRRFGVAESLQDGVGVEDLLLEGARAPAKVVAEVLEDVPR